MLWENTIPECNNSKKRHRLKSTDFEKLQNVPAYLRIQHSPFRRDRNMLFKTRKTKDSSWHLNYSHSIGGNLGVTKSLRSGRISSLTSVTFDNWRITCLHFVRNGSNSMYPQIAWFYERCSPDLHRNNVGNILSTNNDGLSCIFGHVSLTLPLVILDDVSTSPILASADNHYHVY